MVTPPEEQDYATFDEVKISEEVSRQVFNTEFKYLKERLDKQESISFNIIVGAVIATFLVLVGLFFSTWLFMAQYNSSFIQTRDAIQSEIQQTRKENFEFKESLLKEAKGNEQKPITKPVPVSAKKP
ncbi:MAG: hypothetical protein KA731_03230 [Candidatus Moranbacteria bacterium]|nr:hypothetical protein [Candidatus Moranbacteria bacterium]